MDGAVAQGEGVDALGEVQGWGWAQALSDAQRAARAEGIATGSGAAAAEEVEYPPTDTESDTDGSGSTEEDFLSDTESPRSPEEDRQSVDSITAKKFSFPGRPELPTDRLLPDKPTDMMFDMQGILYPRRNLKQVVHDLQNVFIQCSSLTEQYPGFTSRVLSTLRPGRHYHYAYRKHNWIDVKAAFLRELRLRYGSPDVYHPPWLTPLDIQRLFSMLSRYPPVHRIRAMIMFGKLYKARTLRKRLEQNKEETRLLRKGKKCKSRSHKDARGCPRCTYKVTRLGDFMPSRIQEGEVKLHNCEYLSTALPQERERLLSESPVATAEAEKTYEFNIKDVAVHVQLLWWLRRHAREDQYRTDEVVGASLEQKRQRQCKEVEHIVRYDLMTVEEIIYRYSYILDDVRRICALDARRRREVARRLAHNYVTAWRKRKYKRSAVIKRLAEEKHVAMVVQASQEEKEASRLKNIEEVQKARAIVAAWERKTRLVCNREGCGGRTFKNYIQFQMHNLLHESEDARNADRRRRRATAIKRRLGREQKFVEDIKRIQLQEAEGNLYILSPALRARSREARSHTASTEALETDDDDDTGEVNDSRGDSAVDPPDTVATEEPAKDGTPLDEPNGVERRAKDANGGVDEEEHEGDGESEGKDAGDEVEAAGGADTQDCGTDDTGVRDGEPRVEGNEEQGGEEDKQETGKEGTEDAAQELWFKSPGMFADDLRYAPPSIVPPPLGIPPKVAIVTASTVDFGSKSVPASAPSLFETFNAQVAHYADVRETVSRSQQRVRSSARAGVSQQQHSRMSQRAHSVTGGLGDTTSTSGAASPSKLTPFTPENKELLFQQTSRVFEQLEEQQKRLADTPTATQRQAQKDAAERRRAAQEAAADEAARREAELVKSGRKRIPDWMTRRQTEEDAAAAAEAVKDAPTPRPLHATMKPWAHSTIANKLAVQRRPHEGPPAWSRQTSARVSKSTFDGSATRSVLGAPAMEPNKDVMGLAMLTEAPGGDPFVPLDIGFQLPLSKSSSMPAAGAGGGGGGGGMVGGGGKAMGKTPVLVLQSSACPATSPTTNSSTTASRSNGAASTATSMSNASTGAGDEATTLPPARIPLMNEVTRIGRSSKCEICIQHRALRRTISQIHCVLQLVRMEGSEKVSVCIRDNRSKYGTFVVSDEGVVPAPDIVDPARYLFAGDLIILGQVPGRVPQVQLMYQLQHT